VLFRSQEALAALREYGDQATPLAGGTDLLVSMKHKLAKPAHVVDLAGLDGLDQVQELQGALLLGPMLSASALAGDAKLKAQARALALGASVLGSPQVRNRATLGGNVCNARPAADMCVPLLALGATALLQDVHGAREVPLSEFFLGPGRTVRQPSELLCGLKLSAGGPGVGSGYEKLGLRKALEIALVNVAAWLSLEADGQTVKQARVALGAVAPTPILSPGAAAVLAGQVLSDDLIGRAARAAAADARPIDDHRCSADFRRQEVVVLTRRALSQAWRAARQG
jgi:carbon-monoxide dehydrogenase medium subunit